MAVSRLTVGISAIALSALSTAAVAGPCTADFNLGSALGAGVAVGNGTGFLNDFGTTGTIADSGCAGSNDAEDVIFLWTAPATADYIIDTFGSAYDTELQVRDGTDCSIEITCNDDTNGLQSQVTVSLAAGEQIYIVVDSFGTTTGDYVLNIAEDVPPVADCAADVSIGSALGPAVITGTTCGAGADVLPVDPAVCGPFVGAGDGEDVSHTWTAPFTGQFAFTTYGSAYDTTLIVTDGPSAPVCTELACNDDYPATIDLFRSSTVLDLVAGQVINVVVDSYGAGFCGDYSLTILPTSSAGLALETPVAANANVTWTVIGAVPNADIRLYFSRPGATAGNPTPFPGGPSSTLAFPKGVTQTVVDPTGTFQVSATAPSNLPAGLNFSFQGVYWDGASGGVTNIATTISQ